MLTAVNQHMSGASESTRNEMARLLEQLAEVEEHDLPDLIAALDAAAGGDE